MLKNNIGKQVHSIILKFKKYWIVIMKSVTIIIIGLLVNRYWNIVLILKIIGKKY